MFLKGYHLNVLELSFGVFYGVIIWKFLGSTVGLYVETVWYFELQKYKRLSVGFFMFIRVEFLWYYQSKLKHLH